jgi:hypothetical protein
MPTGKFGLCPTFQAKGSIKRTKNDILSKISNKQPHKILISTCNSQIYDVHLYDEKYIPTQKTQNSL